MRIVWVGPAFPLRGGIVAHSAGACRVLRARGHEVRSLDFSRLYPRFLTGIRPGSVRPGKESADGIDALSLRNWRRVGSTISADAIVAQYWSPWVAPALARILGDCDHMRRILICHNAEPHEYFPGSAYFLRVLLRRCDAVMFHSRYVAERVERAYPWLTSGETVTMPLLLGGSIEPWPPAELDRIAPACRRIVVCVGHMRRYKGIDVLAEAWRILDPGPETLLVVAGEPLGINAALRQVEALGDRALTIPRYLADAEVVWLLQNACAAVFPYTRASQSGLLPLALQLAESVVVTNCGGLAGAVAGHRRGRVVKAGDPRALARMLETVIRNARAERDWDRALRHQQGAALDATVVDASWVPFATALERLVMPVSGSRKSNTTGSEPSVDSKVPAREAAEQPWYDGRCPKRQGAHTGTQ